MIKHRINIFAAIFGTLMFSILNIITGDFILWQSIIVGISFYCWYCIWDITKDYAKYYKELKKKNKNIKA